MGIFSGLKNLGLGELEDSDLFAEEQTNAILYLSMASS